LLAGGAAFCAALLAVSATVASSLVPQEWARHHATWVWVATGVLFMASVLLAVATQRHSSSEPQAPTVDESISQVAFGDKNVQVVGDGSVNVSYSASPAGSREPQAGG
jgi:hypothetical protein